MARILKNKYTNLKLMNSVSIPIFRFLNISFHFRNISE